MALRLVRLVRVPSSFSSSSSSSSSSFSSLFPRRSHSSHASSSSSSSSSDPPLMSAVRFERAGALPDALSLSRRARPVPRPGQVRVRVHACGVCHRDVLDRKGAFPFIQKGVVPGHEVAGVVDMVTDGVKSLRMGDRVVSLHWAPCGHCEACVDGKTTHCHERSVLSISHILAGPTARVRRQSFIGLTTDGGYADYMVCDASAFVPVPKGFTAVEAASIMCTFGTFWHAAIGRGRLQPGERLLVTGASGGVGSAAVLIAKAMGCHVTSVTSSESKVDFLRSLGTDEVVVAADGAAYHKHPALASGVDVALEAVGAPTFMSALRALRPAGRLVLVGNVTAGQLTLPIGLSILNSLEIIGSDSCTAPELARCFEFMRNQNVRPLISQVLPLSEYATAQANLEARKVTGRIVLQVADEDW